MFDALIAGKLFGTPEQRLGKSGKPFVVGKVCAAAGDGESLFVNLIAFNDAACSALLALAGSITPKVWTDRQGNARPVVDLVAHQVLTVYHVKRKRAATEGVRPASTSDDFFHEPQDG